MATLIQVIDPLSIATNGLVGGIVQSKQVQYVNALTVATMGWIAFIEESVIPDEPDEGVEPSGGRRMRPKKAKKTKKKKRFVITVEVNGRFYTQTKYTSDLTVSADDVKIQMSEKQGKPVLRVILPNEDEN